MQENTKTDEMYILLFCSPDECPQIGNPGRRFASVAAQITDLHQLVHSCRDCFLAF